MHFLFSLLNYVWTSGRIPWKMVFSVTVQNEFNPNGVSEQEDKHHLHMIISVLMVMGGSGELFLALKFYTPRDSSNLFIFTWTVNLRLEMWNMFSIVLISGGHNPQTMLLLLVCTGHYIHFFHVGLCIPSSRFSVIWLLFLVDVCFPLLRLTAKQENERLAG